MGISKTPQIRVCVCIVVLQMATNMFISLLHLEPDGRVHLLTYFTTTIGETTGYLCKIVTFDGR